MKLVLRSLAAAAALLTASNMMAYVYIAGDFINNWDVANPPQMNDNMGVYTYTVTGNGEFKISEGLNNDNEQTFESKAFAPKGWTSGRFFLSPGQTYEYEAWGNREGNAPNLTIYQPGTYTITVNVYEQTVTVSGTAQNKVHENWNLRGDLNGWGCTAFDMAYNNGVYTMKTHLDSFSGNFKIATENWAYQYCLHNGKINGFGTYEFESGYDNCPDSKFEDGVTLTNVNMVVTWDQRSNATAHKMTVLLADAAGIDNIVAGAGEAEYFSISGIRVATEDLTPGLYICRKGGKTSKVIIK